MTASLGVWLRDQRVGTLSPTRNGAAFRYDDDVAGADRGAPLLSASLPVRGETCTAESTRNWFTGLLPEDRQLDEVRRRFNLESGSYFDVLREIGWECAGAVVIAPEDSPEPVGSLRPLTSSELADRLVALPSRPYDTDDALRISLGGFQAKMLVTRVADGWALPVGGAISSHILKPQPATAFPGLIEAEAWGMAVASRVTETANTELLLTDGSPATLAIERFDREVIDGIRRRTHQEDAAQAMGIPPERKYATGQSGSRSDPTFRRIATLLERYGASPRDELRRLAEQMTINVALGNTDAHAKNFGMLHPDTHVIALSPLYDVVPATVVNPGVLEMGLRIDDTLRIDRITGTKLVAEATSWGIGERAAGSIVSDTLEKLRESVRETTIYPDASPLLAQTALASIEKLSLTVHGTG